jgi:hypothetical protein
MVISCCGFIALTGCSKKSPVQTNETPSNETPLLPATPVLSYPINGQIKIANSGVMLSWHMYNNAQSYTVQVSADPQFGNLIRFR